MHVAMQWFAVLKNRKLDSRSAELDQRTEGQMSEHQILFPYFPVFFTYDFTLCSLPLFLGYKYEEYFMGVFSFCVLANDMVSY